ncbi:hypothetical protein [Chondrinema litorale]|uniref:hypothetical protein n=1 Tax=Chondrinema litorale TaxID=2994555 RepID=UPI0025439136|nr:hypothetical protein [Chondrinema litorale]UZR94118.1 hypothetical protein OQ292_19945 [Chondrinema litorale]
MEIILDKPYAKISHDIANEVFFLQFEGNISDTDYKDVWEVLLQNGKACDLKKLIIDQRKIGKVSMTARAWYLMNWIPRAKKGVNNNCNVAIISSSYVANKVGINYLVNGVKKFTSFNVKFVLSKAEGEDWFKEIASHAA